MDLQLTYDEATKIDKAMAEHMYGHTISNSYASFACDPHCRTRAIQTAINRVLREKDDNPLPKAGWGCPDCGHNHTGKYVPDGGRPEYSDGRCIEDAYGRGCGCERRRPEKVTSGGTPEVRGIQEAQTDQP